MTLISKGENVSPNRSLNLKMEVIGVELVSWKRRVESWLTSQSSFVKFSLSIITITGFTFGGFALAQTNIERTPPSSFETYQVLRAAEAAVKGSQALPEEKTKALVAAGFDLSDDYVREIFGSPVPPQVTAAEAVVKHPLESALDNGAPPLPGHSAEAMANAVYGRGRGTGIAFNGRNLLWPMRGGQVTSRFGMRWGRMHQGTDIAAPVGTPILAAASGEVVFSGWESGYGQLVVIDHGNGTKTKYGHCSVRLVSVGDAVKQGDVIGKVGMTGRTTGPHLHYEVVHSGRASNPENFTRRR